MLWVCFDEAEVRLAAAKMGDSVVTRNIDWREIEISEYS
jgi:hypothetical protein